MFQVLFTHLERQTWNEHDTEDMNPDPFPSVNYSSDSDVDISMPDTPPPIPTEPLPDDVPADQEPATQTSDGLLPVASSHSDRVLRSDVTVLCSGTCLSPPRSSVSSQSGRGSELGTLCQAFSNLVIDKNA